MPPLQGDDLAKVVQAEDGGLAAVPEKLATGAGDASICWTMYSSRRPSGIRNVSPAGYRCCFFR
jgi:hypothetical protein